MLCPRCRSTCTEGTWRSRVRRGDKELRVHLQCWRCSSCRLPTGPFQFVTPELATANDALEAAAWQATFSEDIPPPLPGTRLRRLMRTEEGKARVAQAFGKVLARQVQERKP
jgi:hypothetical protein